MAENKGGRPTIYNQEIVDKTKEYLETYHKSGEEVIPTIEGLSLFLGIDRSTVYDWIKQAEKKEFSYITRKITAKQQTILMNKGLEGKFNPAITKLMLGTHGISEKNYTEIAGVDGKPVITKIERVIIDNK
jgi:hypothetical protein